MALALLVPYAVVASQPERVLITDMGGRSVAVPKRIRSVLSRSPVGTLIMYSINPEKIAGQNWTPTENEKQFLDAEFLDLPVLSGWYADGKVGNVEEIIKAAPDVILSAFFQTPGKGVVDQAERIQAQLNIPVLLIDAGFESMPETYGFLGALLEERERCMVLADETRSILEDIVARAVRITENKRARVYYAEGATGLQTDPSGSWHSRVIDMVNAENVARVEIKGGMGRSIVSPEQLLAWNPEVIIACHDQGFSRESSAYSTILRDSRLGTVAAIANGRVYEVPYKPFNFLDRPPSINRLIGLKWLGNLLYPHVFDYNVREETKKFFKTYYRIVLTEEQVDDIFQNAE